MRFPAFLALVLACACGGDDENGEEVDCTKIAGTDVFVVGLQKTGNQGILTFQMMSADPAPPARGDNTWIVQINEPGGSIQGVPLDGATLTVTPFMPAHQHGTPIKVNVMPGATAGQYMLSPVNLWMPGVWETTIRATKDATSDSAVYSFCIN